MCWLTIQRDAGAGDAAAEAVAACAAWQSERGGDSWGVAWVADGELTMRHGVGWIRPGDVEELRAIDTDIAVGHTRYATRGDVDERNAHPFAVRDESGETVAAVAHNGTWDGAPDTDRADSYYIARMIESFVRAGVDVATALQSAGDATGQTLAVVTRDGRGLTYAGERRVTELTHSVRSTGGTPIRTGDVAVL